ncbi:MAG: TetR/AcrR family transcriptional regulator [Myxococcota bacterium]
MNTKADTATRILEAADELFSEAGFDAVSMRDVAERAGVTKGLVFYRFGSKQALFEQVLDRYYAAHREALEGALDMDAPLEARLHGLVDAYVDFMEDHRRYARMVQREVSSDRGPLPVVQRSLGGLLRSVEAALGGVTPPEGPLAARHFFVTFSGSVINYFTYAGALEPTWGGDPLSPEAREERRAHLHWLVDTLAGALRAEADG